MSDQPNAGRGAPTPKRAQNGQTAEGRLEELLAEYGPWLRRTVARHCPRNLGINPDEVEQEAILRLWKALERESNLENPTSYLYRVVSTATIDAIRRVRARREDSIETDDESMPHPQIQTVDTAPGPERLASSTDLSRALEQALGTLSENRRLAVKLHLQGFNTREIGELLGWTEAKARNLASRGMQDLRRSLEQAGVRDATE